MTEPSKPREWLLDYEKGVIGVIYEVDDNIDKSGLIHVIEKAELERIAALDDQVTSKLLERIKELEALREIDRAVIANMPSENAELTRKLAKAVEQRNGYIKIFADYGTSFAPRIIEQNDAELNGATE